MTDRKKCDWVDCPRPANERSGQCDLHDAHVMADEARDLLGKVLHTLDRIARLDREDNHD